MLCQVFFVSPAPFFANVVSRISKNVYFCRQLRNENYGTIVNLMTRKLQKIYPTVSNFIYLCIIYLTYTKFIGSNILLKCTFTKTQNSSEIFSEYGSILCVLDHAVISSNKITNAYGYELSCHNTVTAHRYSFLFSNWATASLSTYNNNQYNYFQNL